MLHLSEWLQRRLSMSTALYRILLRLNGWTRDKRYNNEVYCGPLSSQRLIIKMRLNIWAALKRTTAHSRTHTLLFFRMRQCATVFHRGTAVHVSSRFSLPKQNTTVYSLLFTLYGAESSVYFWWIPRRTVYLLIYRVRIVHILIWMVHLVPSSISNLYK